MQKLDAENAQAAENPETAGNPETMENPETAEDEKMTGLDRREQKLIGAELRRQRENRGLTQAELAVKMGGDYTEEFISRYENGDIPMEIGSFFTVLEVLHADINAFDPVRLMGKLYSRNGYADLSEKQRRLIDEVIQALSEKL